MVIIFFTVNKGTINEEKHNFAKHLKENVLNGIDQLTVKEINLNNMMKELVNDNLDTLFKLNDDLIRDEQEIESFLKSLEKQLSSLNSNPLQIKFRGTLLEPKKAITEFTWDEGKYPNRSKTISDIMHKINEKYAETRKTIKAKTDDYNNSLNELKAKKKGQNDALNLMKQDYRDLVIKSKSEMKNTDYLCTMLCFVPHGSEKHFLDEYMKLVDGFVVPYSALRIDRGEDEKMQLYRVIIMKHVKDDFKTQCQGKLRIPCREYNEEELSKKPMEEKEIEKFGEKYQSLLVEGELNNSYCISNINLTISRGSKLDRLSYIKVGIYPCVNNTENNNHCKSREVIDQHISGTFLTLLVKDIGLDPSNYSDPVIPIFKEIRTTLDKSFFRDLILYFGITEIQTDEGLLTENIHKENYINFIKSHQNIYYRDVVNYYNGETMGEIQFKIGDDIRIQKSL